MKKCWEALIQIAVHNVTKIRVIVSINQYLAYLFKKTKHRRRHHNNNNGYF